MVTLYIKNMVCNRCIGVVQQEAGKIGLPLCRVALGELTLQRALIPEEQVALEQALSQNGFELIDDHKSRIINQIKTLVIQSIHQPDFKPSDQNYSDFLEKHLRYDYTYLSMLFSEIEGRTLEKFIIAHKIERVKELIVYGQQTLSQIAFDLGYSSVQHLSSQFRKVTGLTPSHFRQLSEHKRQSLDKV